MYDGRSSVFKASSYNRRGAIDDEENTKTVPSHRVTAIPLTSLFLNCISDGCEISTVVEWHGRKWDECRLLFGGPELLKGKLSCPYAARSVGNRWRGRTVGARPSGVTQPQPRGIP